MLWLRNVAAAALAATVFGAVQDSTARDDWRSRQVRWWDDDALIEDAIVSAARLQAERKAQSDRSLVDHSWRVVSLLLLFDSRNSSRSLDALAGVSSYYLGESGNEIYECLLLRKGVQIRARLEKRLTESTTECSRSTGNSGVCLSETDFKNRLKRILTEIDKNTPCTIEQ